MMYLLTSLAILFGLGAITCVLVWKLYFDPEGKNCTAKFLEYKVCASVRIRMGGVQHLILNHFGRMDQDSLSAVWSTAQI
jgi:hypothetical protein